MKLKSEVLFAALIVSSVLYSSYTLLSPISALMDWSARWKANNTNKNTFGEYELYDTKTNSNDGIDLLIDIKSGKHFWHPQIVVWLEDTTGNFIETLFITKSSAKGLFLGGRTSENFKSFDLDKDENQINQSGIRLVDALPYWSHSRGIESFPGFNAPTREQSVPDAITGATPKGNFYISTKANTNQNAFDVYLEVNVAFDDNEFYSEYDYPDDSLYHGGTGLLGQPSLIYKARLVQGHGNQYELMELQGHSHHSGQNGELYIDLSVISTAKEIIDRIVVNIIAPA